MNDTKNLTPAQKQYAQIKKQHNDCIVFFRLGDFYEVFYEDAKICSKVLDLTLTSRNKNAENPIPMAGVPYHSAEKYISKLINAGYKIAIAEQTGPVKPGQIVEREVVAVVTPGTYLQDKEFATYNFISGIYYDEQYHLVWGDFSIGEYWTKSFKNIDLLLKFLLKISPAELVIHIDFPEKEQVQTYLKNFSQVFISIYDLPDDVNFFLKSVLQVQTLSSYGQSIKKGRDKATALLFNYLRDTQKTALKNTCSISYRGDEDKILCDNITLKNLEIFVSSYEGSRRHSLLWVIDHTRTPMGGRLLHSLLLAPSKNIKEINTRLENIQYYIDNQDLCKNIGGVLSNIGDISRLSSRIVYKKNSPFIWNRLLNILAYILSENISAELLRLGLKKAELNRITKLYELGIGALKEEGFAEDMDFIKDGYDEQVDELRKIAYHSDELLLDYQKELSGYTSLNMLKIKYITNQGYFIEVSKKDVQKFEDKAKRSDEKFDFIRRQTLKSAERYTTPYLESIQNKILTAREKLSNLEKQILEDLKAELEEKSKDITQLANHIAWLDIYTSFAQFAKSKGWVMPKFTKNKKIEIKGGTHPVIQEYLPKDESFIPNDLYMDTNTYTHIITGPNMGGKSTFLRQNALIVFLAHCGLFVPAKEARLHIVDGIFARVGSGDILAKNQSTFMTEMIEVSNILHNSTADSFVVLDELGRGTSTYDGMALAKAILVYLARKTKAKTLFATHYHELINLEGNIPGVNNFSVSVYETDQEVVFLKKIVKGGASKSYGIDVAKLAGVPKQILDTATKYLKDMEEKQLKSQYADKPLFGMDQVNDAYKDKYEQIKKQLQKIDLYNITPVQAMQMLDQLRQDLDDMD